MQSLLSSSNLSMALIDSSDVSSGSFYLFFFAKENLIFKRFFIRKAVSESKIRFY